MKNAKHSQKQVAYHILAGIVAIILAFSLFAPDTGTEGTQSSPTDCGNADGEVVESPGEESEPQTSGDVYIESEPQLGVDREDGGGDQEDRSGGREPLIFEEHQNQYNSLDYYEDFTPTVYSALQELLKNEKIVVSSVCRTWSPVWSGHSECASVDISIRPLDDVYGAVEWIESFGLVCEGHKNLDVNSDTYLDEISDIIRPIGTPETHLHCTDVWWLDQQNDSAYNPANESTAVDSGESDSATPFEAGLADSPETVVTEIHNGFFESAKEMAGWEYVGEMTVTTYNPEVGQTDSTPCIAGGNNIDICQMAEEGRRPIAASQDLLTWAGGAPFEAYDTIILESTDFPDDWRCNGEFEVVDGMNKKYRDRLDIFMMDRADNISCNAKVYLK